MLVSYLLASSSSPYWVCGEPIIITIIILGKLLFAPTFDVEPVIIVVFVANILCKDKAFQEAKVISKVSSEEILEMQNRKVLNSRHFWEKATVENVTSIFLDEKNSINELNSIRQTYLMSAIKANTSPSVIKTLVELGADINFQDKDGVLL